MPDLTSVLIVGAGDGLSASLARLLSRQPGTKIGLAARNIDKLASLAAETGAATFACDASNAEAVAALFSHMDQALGGPPEIVIYNASGRVRGPFIDLDPAEVERAIAVSAFGGFLVAQQAARRMLPRARGAIVFTGASASIKGYAQSSAFAMGKFALRGLAQSLARELSPQGIHIVHVVIDGGIASASRPVPGDKPDSLLDPDQIAQSYLDVIPPASQCLDVRGGIASMGGTLLSRPVLRDDAVQSCLADDCSGGGLDANTGDTPVERREGPVAQWLEPTAHNGLVAGSSPAGPTTDVFIKPMRPVGLGACHQGDKAPEPSTPIRCESFRSAHRASLEFRWSDHRHDETYALGGQHIAPIGNECLYALPTARTLRSRSNRPTGQTWPRCSRRATSQSI